ncbi:alpha/beta hydrolase [Luteolibacter algae]|uniref:Alpha/beta hydrolase n=1 Tax=Luteolibacter algae TaxID=454151 RepID=A0ABW5D8G6_9BACT
MRLLCFLFLTATFCRAELPTSFSLWQDGPPGSEKYRNESEKNDGNLITNVHNPSLTPYLPSTETATGTAIIICPGGGHKKLCVGSEGYELAEWFRDRGIAAFVLKYRLEKDEGCAEKPYTLAGDAMADTRRAIRTVRSRAPEWQIDPERIGIIGFSAGGELAALSAMDSVPGNAAAVDPVEKVSSRPDFQALIYPGKSDQMTAKPGMPPVFLACGYNDRPDISEGLATLYLKYKAVEIPAEFHVFANAGHGFGYRHQKNNSAASRWPQRLLEWLEDSKLLEDN